MVSFFFYAKVNKKLHSFFETTIKNSKENIYFSDLSIEQIDGGKEAGEVTGLYKFSFNHLFPDFSKYLLIISAIMLIIRFFINSLFLTIPLLILIGIWLLDRFGRSGLFMYLIMKTGLKKQGYNIDDIKWRGGKW